jgi:hypothetical protein
MKTRQIFLIGIFAALLLSGAALATAPAARAQVRSAPSTGYSITWYTVDGGGGTSTSSGGGYTLSGTAGQPDAGTLTSSSPSYTLAGGFWAGVANLLNNLFLPLVRK